MFLYLKLQVEIVGRYCASFTLISTVLNSIDHPLKISVINVYYAV